ncbi:MAG: hypothetical protein Fur0028_01840 [Bacteroidales bacterium]
MKTNLFIVFLILFVLKAHSQGLVVTNTANLVLTSNSNFILSQNANFINNGNVTCANNSNVKFTGIGVDQFIGGNNTISFYNLYILKAQMLAPPQTDLFLQQDAIVNGTIYLSQGHLNLRNYLVDLGTTGMVTGENYDARIRATDASKSEGAGTGTIRAIRNNPSGNVAGLGLDITPAAALGNNTRIIRGCNALQGTGSFSGNWSVFRWYRITPGSGAFTPITVNNFYYWGGTGNPELNGHAENELQLFQRMKEGSGPEYWTPREQNVNTGSDYVWGTTTNSNALNYILVTLGSKSTPLPVELYSFNATCSHTGNILIWQTASESNNAGFHVEKSNNSFDWDNIGFVQGNGNTNAIHSYSFVDNSPYYPITYYRLQQVDNDGKSELSSIVSAQCQERLIAEDFNPYYTQGQLQVALQGAPETSYKIIVTNTIGQTLYIQPYRLTENSEIVTVNTPLAAGIYYISIVSENNIISKPILIK